MNRAIYLLFTFLFFYSLSSAQPESPYKRFRADIPDFDFSGDCRQSSSAGLLPVEVDDLPGEIDDIPTDFFLERILIDIAISGDADVSLALLSPNNTRIEIMDTRLGSWPDFDYSSTSASELTLYDRCAPMADHNQSGTYTCPDSESIRWRTIGDLSSLSSEDLTGTWNLEVCGSENTPITISYFELIFNSDRVLNANVFDITNATSCTSNDGSFKLQIGSRACGRKSYSRFSFDNDWTYEENDFDPCNTFEEGEGGFAFNNMAPGLYFYQIAATAEDGSLDATTIRTYPFFIGADDGDPDLFLNCSSPVSVDLGSTVQLTPFDYGDNCGFETVLEYTVKSPSGNTILMGEYDGSRTEFTAFLSGEYRVEWTLTSTENPQLTESCTEIYEAVEGDEATYGISSESDDMEERLSDNSIRDGSTDLEFGSEFAGGVEAQIVGLRFTNIQLPANANVEEAYIQFSVDESKETSTGNYIIRAQSNSNPGTFTTNAGDISSRPMLNTEINWTVPANSWTNPGDRGPNQRTADISSLLELITDQPGWTSGNAVVFTIVGTGTKVAESIEGDPSGAAELYIRSGGDPCDDDTEAPVLTTCPDDFTVQLDDNDQATYTVRHPSASDNCGISSAVLNVTFSGGATDFGGNTMFSNLLVRSGVDVPYNIKGSGEAEFEFVFSDAAGNEETCVVTVTGEATADPCDNDTEAPVLTPCRDDFTVQLEPDGTTSFVVTTPAVSDNCGVQSTFLDLTWANGATDTNGGTILRGFGVTPGTSYRINVVGEGNVEIVWRAIDEAGNEGTCTFTVTSTSGDPCDNDTEDPVFSNCPEDFTVPQADDGGATEFRVTEPSFTDNCNIASQRHVITYLDGTTNESGETTEEYDFIDQGKSFRWGVLGTGTVNFEYTVTDDAGNSAVCSFDIEIESPDGPCANDTEDPVLTNCPQGQTATVDQSGNAIISFTDPNVSDNCGIRSEQIIVRYSNGATDIDGNLERIINDIRPGQGRSIQVSGAGSVNVEFVAIDGNGNSASCDANFNVVNSGTECSFDIADECAIAGQTLSLPVRVTNFDGIGAFQFDLVSSSNDITFVGIENENIDNLNSNILGNGNLRVLWDEPSGGEINLADNFRIFNLVVRASGSFNAEASISGTDIVILSSVNSNGRVGVGNICVGTAVNPSGNISDSDGSSHSGVPVVLTSGTETIDQTTTNAQGNFSFSGTNDSYRVRPVKTDELRRGVNTVDIARIRRHILEQLEITDDYKLVAADVNKDGTINVLDVRFTRQVVLRVRDDFPNNSSWRFIPQALDISDNPNDLNIPEFIRLNQANLNFDALDFVSVKVGDVDNSALFKGDAEEKSLSAAVDLSLPDTTISMSGEFSIPVYVSGSEAISLMSMTLNYDSDLVTLKNVSSEAMQGFGVGNFNDLGGEVLISWDHPRGEDFTGNGVLMMFTFENVASEGTSDLTVSNVEVYDRDFNLFDINSQSGSVTLMTTSNTEVSNAMQLDIYPNPFSESLQIEVQTQLAQAVKVTLKDLTGRVIAEVREDRKQRVHQLQLEGIRSSGVLMVEIEGEDFYEVRKVISIR